MEYINTVLSVVSKAAFYKHMARLCTLSLLRLFALLERLPCLFPLCFYIQTANGVVI